MEITSKMIRRLSASAIVSMVLIALVVLFFNMAIYPLTLYITNDAALAQLSPDNMAVAKMEWLQLWLAVIRTVLVLLAAIPGVRGIFKFYKEFSSEKA